MKDLIVGVISDTHGLVRPQALEALAGAWLILHAGDIGNPEVLDALSAIAPLVAIRGNVDRGAWAGRLPECTSLEILGRRTCIVHDLKTLEAGAAQRYDLVISGHSHQPHCRREGGALFLNPGSAGPRRFKLPVAVGRLRFGASVVEGEVIELSV